MKHLLNYVPTVKFRQGSSFMFKTIITLLYGIPLILFLFNAHEYYGIGEIEDLLNDQAARLEQKQAEFQKKVLETRPDKEEIKALSARTVNYYRSLQAVSFSWSALLETLEELLPGGVKISRIRIKPALTIGVTIDGEAQRLELITEFLRRLFQSERFLKPHLTRHSLTSRTASSTQEFNLEVEYIPPREAQP